MKARVKVAFFDGKLHKVGEIVDVKKPSNLVEVIEESVTKTEVKKTKVEETKVEEETEPVTEVTETVEKKPRKRTTKKRK